MQRLGALLFAELLAPGVQELERNASRSLADTHLGGAIGCCIGFCRDCFDRVCKVLRAAKRTFPGHLQTLAGGVAFIRAARGWPSNVAAQARPKRMSESTHTPCREVLSFLFGSSALACRSLGLACGDVTGQDAVAFSD